MKREETNKALMERLFKEVWMGHEVAALDRYYAPGDYLEGIKKFAQIVFDAFPDWEASIVGMVAEGDKVAVSWTGEGTQQGAFQGIDATGKRTSVRGIDIETISEGKIVYEDGVMDFLAMLRQLGAVLVTI